jgi:hypothetical protein
MRTLPLPARVVFATGALLGVLGDVLLRANGAPGLNLVAWAAAVAGAVVLLYRRSGERLSTEAAVWLGAAVLFAGGAAWRDTDVLKVLALGCTVAAFAIPAYRAGGSWIRQSSVAQVLAAGVSGVAHGAAGVLLLLFGPSAAPKPWRGERSRLRTALAAARGVALAIPLVLVFGGLFMEADTVFAGMVADVVSVDLDLLASHVVLAGFLTWVSSGYLRGVLAGTGHPVLDVATRPRPVLGVTEVATALGVLQLLFLTFVVVQFRYLFGGSALVEVTPGLTYAEYARRGFFELVAVVALSLPLLLAADALLRRETPRHDAVFRVLAGVHIALVFAVMASALQRVRLYQAAYGLTEQRFHATALLILLAVILLWFAATILRGRRNAFAFGAVLAVFTTVAVLHAVNPDAIIARTNVARVHDNPVAAESFDASYVASLSADAVPVLLDALPSLPTDAQCSIAERMLERWPPSGATDIRTWSLSAARARRDVRAAEGRLRAVSLNCG